MKQFMIITNRNKDKDLETATGIRNYLIEAGAECIIDEGSKTEGEGYTDSLGVPKSTECVIVLGGDGTMLQAARDLIDMEIPFMGINLGTLGFLAEVDRDGIPEALDHLLKDHYTIENRMMLLGKCFHEQQQIDLSHSLNDIVITRKGSLQIIHFTIYVNEQLLHRYSADGMIAATPTGSTGYSLSAGGPIVNPKAQLIVLTPICPHSMQNRSIVLSANDQIMIEIETGGDGREQEVEAIFDGNHKVSLTTGDRLEISCSEKTTGIVKLRKESFLEILNKKLGES